MPQEPGDIDELTRTLFVQSSDACLWLPVTVAVVSSAGVQTSGAVRLPAPLTDMNRRTQLWIRLRLTQDLMGDRRDVAFPEQDVLAQMFQRVPLGPTEVNVRPLPGRLPDVK